MFLSTAGRTSTGTAEDVGYGILGSMEEEKWQSLGGAAEANYDFDVDCDGPIPWLGSCEETTKERQWRMTTQQYWSTSLEEIRCGYA